MHASLTALLLGLEPGKKKRTREEPSHAFPSAFLKVTIIIFFVALNYTSQAFLALLLFFLPKCDTGPYSTPSIFLFSFSCTFHTSTHWSVCRDHLEKPYFICPRSPPKFSPPSEWKDCGELLAESPSCLVDLGLGNFPRRIVTVQRNPL